jgi:hypothetical protein
LGDRENHQHCMSKFIGLANELKQGGFEPPLISAALMTASCVYSTYVAAGNQGGLNPSGIDKLVETYRAQLEFVQQRKREEAEKQRTEQESPDNQ